MLFAILGTQASMFPDRLRYYSTPCDEVWPQEPCFRDKEAWGLCAKSRSVTQWFPSSLSVAQNISDLDNSTSNLDLARPEEIGEQRNSTNATRSTRKRGYPKGYGMCCQLPQFCWKHFGMLNGAKMDAKADCCLQLWSHTCVGYQLDAKFRPKSWLAAPLCSNPLPGFET